MLDGFLVLNPRLSLVREAPVESSKLEPSEEQQRMVIVGAFQNRRSRSVAGWDGAAEID